MLDEKAEFFLRHQPISDESLLTSLEYFSAVLGKSYRTDNFPYLEIKCITLQTACSSWQASKNFEISLFSIFTFENPYFSNLPFKLLFFTIIFSHQPLGRLFVAQSTLPIQNSPPHHKFFWIFRCSCCQNIVKLLLFFDFLKKISMNLVFSVQNWP